MHDEHAANQPAVTPPIHALLFDLGGVVFEIDFDRAFAQWESISELSFDAIKRAFHFDEPYRQHECGAISADEYYAHLCTVLKLQPDMRRIEHGWNAIYLLPIHETWQLIEDARKRLPCYAFSNTNAAHKLQWIAQFPGLEALFDHIYTSHEIGARKPERDAFLHVADAIEVAPSSILFFDDTLENVEGARRAGLNAVHVRSPQDVRSALAALRHEPR